MALYGIKIRQVGWMKMDEQWYAPDGRMFFTQNKSIAEAMLLNARNSVRADEDTRIWVEEIQEAENES